MIGRRTIGLAFVISFFWLNFYSVQAAPPEKDDAIYVFDLWKFFEREGIETTAQRVDFAYFITALQGIVNREQPRLYVTASLSLMDIEVQSSTQAKQDIDVTPIDEFWLDYLVSHGDIDAKSIVRTPSLVKILNEFHGAIKGLVVWEMKVPATVNAALTAAGAIDLLPVSNDLGNGRVKKWLINHDFDFPVVLNLCGQFRKNQIGKSVSIMGTEIVSSGSAKADVYHFIQKAYLDTEKASPFHMVFNPDALMWSEEQKIYGAGRFGHLGDHARLQHNGLFNADYWISKRGLFVDLYVWDDLPPSDDLEQPVGADFQAWNDILEASYHKRQGEFGIIGGFVPWWIKYQDDRRDNVATEWRFIDLISSYNMGNDADAAFGISNASFFTHMSPVDRDMIPDPPSMSTEELSGASFDPQAVYLTFFMMDYDGSSWLNQAVDAVYNAGGRGRIPLNWAVNPVLNDRVPHAYRYMIENRTELDFFGIEDDGAAYISPARLDFNHRIGRIQKSGIPYYERFAKDYHDRYKISLTAYYITSGYRRAWGEMAARLTPEGFGMNRLAPRASVSGTPIVRPESFHVNRVDDLRAFVHQIYRDGSSSAAAKDRFHSFRCILIPPYAIAEIVDSAELQFPSSKVKVVDAHTFFQMRQFDQEPKP